jgi:hypothetical protein
MQRESETEGVGNNQSEFLLGGLSVPLEVRCPFESLSLSLTP